MNKIYVNKVLTKFNKFNTVKFSCELIFLGTVLSIICPDSIIKKSVTSTATVLGLYLISKEYKK